MGERIGRPEVQMSDEVITLGLGGATHDFTAALAVNGRIVVAIAEERLTREKHAVDIARMSSDFGTTAELQRQAVDWLRYVIEKRPFERALEYIFDATGVEPAKIAMVGHCCDPRLLPAELAGVSRARFNHHLAHAASSYLASPFPDAAVLVADGAGDRIRGSAQLEATSAYHGRGEALDRLWRVGDPHSIGGLYEAATAMVGFHPLEEGKTMALASFGSNRWYEPLSELVTLLDDGRYAFGAETADIRRVPDRISKISLLRQATGVGERPTDEEKADLARAVQMVTEDVLLHVANHLHTLTRSRSLCIAGGVGLNSVANHRILADGRYDDLFIQPFAGDGGLAIGTALLAAHRAIPGGPPREPMRSAFLGRIYSDEEILAAIGRHGELLRTSDHANVERRTAELLARGDVVGWFQGGAEWGPRALGNRSILADPRDLASKRALDARVKVREVFRPYAPAVLRENQNLYFELEHESPYMLLVAPVRSERAAEIPAVVHVDGTARIQTVDRESNPRFARLLDAFGTLTGVPMLLNTSFNLHGEPIVETPDDAILSFLRCRMDALVLGNIIVERRE
jgi:carbamoyltransferase